MAFIHLIILGLGVRTVETKEGLKFPGHTKDETKRLLINMVYKLLPLREEQKDWQLYLDGCMLEIQGMHNIFHTIDSLDLVRLLSKLESLKLLEDEDSFYEYRRTVLECTNMIE